MGFSSGNTFDLLLILGVCTLWIITLCVFLWVQLVIARESVITKIQNSFIGDSVFKLIFLILALTKSVFADNLHIDDFAFYINKDINNIKEQRINAFKSLSVEDDLFTFYYFLGVEEEGQRLLQKYLEFCINDHLKFRSDHD